MNFAYYNGTLGIVLFLMGIKILMDVFQQLTENINAYYSSINNELIILTVLIRWFKQRLIHIPNKAPQANGVLNR